MLLATLAARDRLGAFGDGVPKPPPIEHVPSAFFQIGSKESDPGGAWDPGVGFEAGGEAGEVGGAPGEGGVDVEGDVVDVDQVAFDLAVTVGDEEVAGLEVAVEDSLGVHSAEEAAE